MIERWAPAETTVGTRFAGVKALSGLIAASRVPNGSV
jgi:hypothetical protein